MLIKSSTFCTALYIIEMLLLQALCIFTLLIIMVCWLILHITIIIIFPSEGFSGGSQSSVAGYNQLPFPAASQTHLTSETEGRQEYVF